MVLGDAVSKLDVCMDLFIYLFIHGKKIHQVQ